MDEELAKGVMLDKTYLFKDGERPKLTSLVENGMARTVHTNSIQNVLSLENDLITRHTRNGASTRTFIENRRPKRFSSTDNVQSIILSMHSPKEEEDSKI